MYARLVFAGLLGAFAFPCLAQFAGVPPVVAAGTSGGSVAYGGGLPSAFQRQITSSPGSAARIIDNIRLSLPAGAVAEVAAGRIITKAALTAAVGIAVGTGVGAVGVALAPVMWDYMKSKGYLPGGMVDPGQEKTSTGGLMHDFRTGQPMAPGAIAAREAEMSCANKPSQWSCAVEVSTGYCGSTTCTFQWGTVFRDANSNVQQRLGGGDTGPMITAVICPATNLGPVVVAYGGGPCPSDTRIPATEAQKLDAISAMPESIMPQVVEELAEKVPMKTEQPVLSGPASVTAPPKVTTKPDGTVQTETKTHNITYQGNTYNYVTTSTTNEGDTTTTVQNDLPKEDPKTDCEKNPGAVGCLEVGTIPSVDLPGSTVNVSANPQGGWGADSGGCPAPRVVDVLGQAVTIDNSILCQFLSGIRFAVIGAFGLVAVMVFVGGLRQ